MAAVRARNLQKRFLDEGKANSSQSELQRRPPLSHVAIEVGAPWEMVFLLYLRERRQLTGRSLKAPRVRLSDALNPRQLTRGFVKEARTPTSDEWHSSSSVAMDPPIRERAQMEYLRYVGAHPRAGPLT